MALRPESRRPGDRLQRLCRRRAGRPHGRHRAFTAGSRARSAAGCTWSTAPSTRSIAAAGCRAGSAPPCSRKAERLGYRLLLRHRQQVEHRPAPHPLQMVRPLDARLGFGLPRRSEPGRQPSFERIWSDEALRWRMANPEGRYSAVRRRRPAGDPLGDRRCPGVGAILYQGSGFESLPDLRHGAGAASGLAGPRPRSRLEGIGLPAHPDAPSPLPAQPRLQGPDRRRLRARSGPDRVPRARLRRFLTVPNVMTGAVTATLSIG